MTKLFTKSVGNGDIETHAVEIMMKQLFPMNEQTSIDELLELAHFSNCKFDVYYVEKEVCGYGMVFIYYLAVDEK